MAVIITTKVRRGKRIPQKLERLRTRLDDRSQPMNELKTYAMLRWRKNFESQGAIYGAWEPLSRWSWRRGYDHGGTPLVLTGALFMNVMSQSRQGKVSKNAITWNFRNTPPSYPLSHQFGYNPHFKQPPRVIWTLNEEDEQHAHKVIESFVRQQVRRL